MDEEKPTFERMVLLAAVAQSYYVDRASQDDIAAKYGFSRSNISRMLSEARRHGLVDIRIRHPIPTSPEHEQALAELFPHSRALVIHPSRTEEETVRQVGLAAWREIERHLCPGGVLGVSWGRSLWAAVEHARGISIPGARVVQLGGAEDATARDRIHNVAAHLGRRLGIDVVHFPAPLLADDAQAADVLLAQSSVRAVIDLASRATAAAVGIGAIKEKLSGRRRSRFDARSARELQEAGAVGDICGYHFDHVGKMVPCAQNQRVIGIGPDRFKALAHKIAIATGPAKAEAIRAAILGGWVDILVTDVPTVEAILDLEVNEADA